jgi:hypothetical protein
MRTRRIYLWFGLSLTISLALIQWLGPSSNLSQFEGPSSLLNTLEYAPSVAYCDLVNNPTHFENAMVRTEATFNKTLENRFFTDDRCNKHFIWVEFDPAYVRTDEGLKTRFEELACLKEARCKGAAMVTAVGRFEGRSQSGYGRPDCCPFRFSIVKLEDVAPAPQRNEDMESEIESASKKLGVQNLKAIDGQDEIRVWVGFGITQPRLFVLKLLVKPQGSFHTLSTLPEPNDTSLLDVPESIPLSNPKSDWPEFENFLKSKGVDSPMRLSSEGSDYVRSPDVQTIAIETKFDDKYSLVFFHLDNPSDDAKRALTICRRIEREFDVNMYCGTSRERTSRYSAFRTATAANLSSLHRIAR